MDAQLILLGIQPSELENMPDFQRWDVLAIYEAQEALKRKKMPGQK